MSLQGIFDPTVRAYFKKKYGSGGGNSANDGYFLMCEDENESKGTFNIEGMGIGVHLGDKILTAEEAIGANMVQKMVIGGSIGYDFLPNIESAEEAFGLTFVYCGNFAAFVSGKKGTYYIDGMVIELPLDGTYGLKASDQSATMAFIAIGKA